MGGGALASGNDHHGGGALASSLTIMGGALGLRPYIYTYTNIYIYIYIYRYTYTLYIEPFTSISIDPSCSCVRHICVHSVFSSRFGGSLAGLPLCWKHSKWLYTSLRVLRSWVGTGVASFRGCNAYPIMIRCCWMCSTVGAYS